MFSLVHKHGTEGEGRVMAYMSERDDRRRVHDPYAYVSLNAEENAADAIREAERILAETEPRTATQGVVSRHYTLDALGYAGPRLADSLRAILPVLEELAADATLAIHSDADLAWGDVKTCCSLVDRNRATLAAMEAEAGQ
jgi:hypothetical protein